MEIYWPSEHTPRETIVDGKARQKLWEVTENFLVTWAVAYWPANIQITKTKIAIDTLLWINTLFMEYIQIHNWDKQMKWYEKLYGDNFFENIQIFWFANFFHILALAWLTVLIPRIKYYYLYYQGRKLLEELNSTRWELKWVNDILEIENISPTVTYNPWKSVDL
jgi:hypothetical protein